MTRIGEQFECVAVGFFAVQWIAAKPGQQAKEAVRAFPVETLDHALRLQQDQGPRDLRERIEVLDSSQNIRCVMRDLADEQLRLVQNSLGEECE
jgi:hypothetical protein